MKLTLGMRVTASRPLHYSNGGPWWRLGVPDELTGTITIFDHGYAIVKLDEQWQSKFGSQNWCCLPEWLTPEGGPW